MKEPAHHPEGRPARRPEAGRFSPRLPRIDGRHRREARRADDRRLESALDYSLFLDQDQSIGGSNRYWPALCRMRLVAFHRLRGIMSRSVPEVGVIELNIRHYRDLLERESDPEKRDAFAKLLAAEQAKLAALVAGNGPLN
jgi:hypothetical protein